MNALNLATETDRQEQVGFMDAVDSSTVGAASGGAGFPVPSECFTAPGVVDRSYVLNGGLSVNWSTSDAVGHVLYSTSFPSELIERPRIAEAVNGFAYFRSGVTVSVRPSVQQYLFGACMIYARPFGHPAAGDVFEASGWPSAIISGATKDVVNLTLPFVWPEPLWALEDTRQWWTVDIMVLNALTDCQAGEAATAHLLVNAQFTGHEMYGPVGKDTATALRYNVIGRELGRTGRAHGKDNGTRKYRQRMEQLLRWRCLMTAATVMSTAHVLHPDPDRAEDEAFYNRASGIGIPPGYTARGDNFVPDDMTKVDLGGDTHAHGPTEAGEVAAASAAAAAASAAPRTTTEAVKKVQMADTTAKTAFVKAKGGIYDTPILGWFARAGHAVIEGVGSIVSTGVAKAVAGGLLAMIGLDKPTYVTPPTETYTVYSQGDYAEGLSYARSLGYFQNNDLGHNKFFDKKDYMNLQEMARKPQLVYKFSMNAASGPTVISVHPYLSHQSSDNTIKPSYIAAATMPFSLWRGSLVFSLNICSSQYCTGSLRIRHIPHTNVHDFNPSSMAFPEDVATQVIDIKATTNCSFAVPQISHTVWQSTGMINGIPNYIGYKQLNTGVLVFDWLSPLTCPDTEANTPIYINVWLSAGPDFQTSQPHGYFAFANSDTATAHLSVEEDILPTTIPFHPSYRGNVMLNMTTGEVINNILHFLHIPQWITTHAPGESNSNGKQDDFLKLLPGTEPRFLLNSGVTAKTPLHFFCNFFAFWRGGFNVTVEYPDGAAAGPTYLQFTASGDVGMIRAPLVTASTAIRQRVDVKMPFYSQLMIQPMRSGAWEGTTSSYPSYPYMVLHRYRVMNGWNQTHNYYLSVSDDFQMEFLKPAQTLVRSDTTPYAYQLGTASYIPAIQTATPAPPPS